MRYKLGDYIVSYDDLGTRYEGKILSCNYNLSDTQYECIPEYDFGSDENPPNTFLTTESRISKSETIQYNRKLKLKELIK